MKHSIVSPILLLALVFAGCGQAKRPGPMEVKSFVIGARVDTSLFQNMGGIHLPTYLDGWTMDNYDKLPEEYMGLPIATWTLKSDSGIVLTLLNDVVLTISVSYMTDAEQQQMTDKVTKMFGFSAKERSYEEEHPLQEWITYWTLKTWEAGEVVVQIGTSDMRKPKDPAPKETRWNMVYSDRVREDQIIAEFKKTLFADADDSLRYMQQLNAYKNRNHPPEDGVYEDRYDNGLLKEKGSYRRGKKDGRWQTWYENGQKEDSALYVSDELKGARIMWHANGKVMLESNWGKPGEKIGRWVRYYDNGNRESVSHYDSDGGQQGTDTVFFASGKPQRITIYDNDLETGHILYSEDGKVIQQFQRASFK